MDFKIGCDPEVFVGDANGVRSIIGKIGGTKEYPMPLPIGDGFAVQEDNVALEFNIPPSGSKAEFIHNLNKATKFLEQAVKDLHGLHFVKESAVSFPESEMYDPKAFEFGCEPDYNCWTGKVNPKPKAKDKFLRSCGGHVHIGVDGLDAREVGKGCDLVLGVPSVLMDQGFLRKSLYGKHGAYRPKSYGMEYRVLSNFWVVNPDDKYREWVYDGVDRVLDMVNSGVEFNPYYEDIVEAIDNNNQDIAKKLIKHFNLNVL
jgi:hypothetical protein